MNNSVEVPADSRQYWHKASITKNIR